MTDKNSFNDMYVQLRATAEKILREEGNDKLRKENLNLLQILHELEVHQIELDLQNEELKRAVSDLEEARKEYYDLFNSAPIGFLTLSREGKIERLNQAAIDLVPQLADIPRKQHFQNLIYPEDLPQYHEATKSIEAVGISGRKETLELQLATSEDMRLYVRLDISADFDPQGHLSCLRLAMADISHRKQAEVQLRESEQKFRNSFFHTAIGFAITDLDGRFLDANPAFCSLTGYALKELKSMEFAELIHPEDIAESTGEIDRLLDGQISGFALQSRYVCKDGNVAYVHKSVSLTADIDGYWKWIVFLVEDITDRKKADEALKQNERRFRALTERSGEFVAILDENGRIIYSVIGNASKLHYSPNELLGRNAFDLVHPDDRADASKTLRRLLQQAGKSEQMELRVRDKDGAWLWMIISGANLLHETAIGGIVVNGRDITQLKRMEENLELRVQKRTNELALAIQGLKERSDQLRKMTSELITAEERERQRLSRILHDGLQQMLVGAIFQIDVLEQDHRMPDDLNRLKEILAQASETSRTLATELSPPILLRRDLCAALQWLVDWMGKTHGLTVDLISPENIQGLKDEVFLLLFQASRELLFNVAKHAGVRKARVEVNQQDGLIMMTVEDKGAGFRADKSGIKGEKTRGFGLFSLNERLALLGGQLKIESKPGQGSRIKLTLPLFPVTKDAAKASAVEQLSNDAAVHPEAKSEWINKEMKIRIMLIDDHEVVRQGVANLISRNPDFEIVGEASDGKSAVDLVREMRPDVVLMDINMPVMDGIQATGLIHNEFPDIRIIGFSIYEEEIHREAMLKAGAAAYVCKRGSSKDLIETIRACL